MNYFLSKIEERLTEDEKRQLADIYEVRLLVINFFWQAMKAEWTAYLT